MQNFGILLILVLGKKMPINLIQNIYEEHFEANFVYKKFLHIVNSKKSMRLNIEPLFNFVKIIFYKNRKNSIIVPYICKNHEIFNTYYRDHYVKIVKHFIKMETDCSFAACILMDLYH
jgi:hypothetical protein